MVELACKSWMSWLRGILWENLEVMLRNNHFWIFLKIIYGHHRRRNEEDLGVNFMTVQSWLEALERLYFIFKIRPYAGRLARTLRREEKVYLFDFSTIEKLGARFKNLVALHLYKLCDAWTDWGFGDFTLYYVRDREKRWSIS